MNWTLIRILTIAVALSALLAWGVSEVVTPIASDLAPQVLKQFEAVERTLDGPKTAPHVKTAYAADTDAPAEIDFNDLPVLIDDTLSSLDLMITVESSKDLQSALDEHPRLLVFTRDCLVALAQDSALRTDTPRLCEKLSALMQLKLSSIQCGPLVPKPLNSPIK